MSLESARLFVQEIYQNRDYADKVMKIEDIKELMDFAIKTGFEFAIEELKEVNQELQSEEN